MAAAKGLGGEATAVVARGWAAAARERAVAATAAVERAQVAAVLG